MFASRAFNRAVVASTGFAAGFSFVYATTQRSQAAGIDYDKVKADIVAAIEKDDEKRGNGTSIAPTLVRLS